MTREIDLIAYLPDFMLPYQEPVEAMKSLHPEFELIWNAADQILYNRFLSTANEYGISRYERLLGIYPESGDTLEDRRTKVQSMWFKSIPYTLRELLGKLVVLFGKDGFKLYANFKQSGHMEVVVNGGTDMQMAELRYILGYMLPMNIYATIRNSKYGSAAISTGALSTISSFIRIKALTSQS